MSDIEIVNPVPVEEVRPWLATLATTFLDEAEGERFDRYVEFWQRDWPAERIWGARADGRWVATLATEARSITVPGYTGTRDVEVDALTAVTVNATHRRRGLLSGMLSQSLQQAHDRNDPFSILIAAEWPIYGRFGYAPATNAANYSYAPRRSRVEPTPGGSVRQVDPADLGKMAPDVFDRARALRVGQVDRRGDWWPRRLGLDGYRPIHHGKAPNVYVHESEGMDSTGGTAGPDGLLWWSPEQDFELHGARLGAISVGDLVAASDLAYRNLWAFLGGIDVVDEITLRRRPTDEPVRWLLPDARALRLTGGGDDVWIRMLDVPGALTARRYAAAGRLVLDVIDTDGGRYAAGRYVLEADGADAACQPTDATADLRITQRALASIYLGGWTLAQLALGGGAVEVRTGAIDQATAMFATSSAPWNATGF